MHTLPLPRRGSPRQVTLRRSSRSAAAVASVPVLVSAISLVSAPAPSSGAASVPQFPKVFVGQLTDTERHAASTTDSGNFSAYSATARFGNLTFSNGAEGPFTLEHGTLAYSGYQVMQTAPNPGGRTCTATYRFALDRNEPLFGDIGGFSSLGNGRYSVTIDLGFDTSGTVVASSNCGPGLEFTSHPFGEPIRADKSIQATGVYNSSTGVIAVNSTMTYSGDTNTVVGQLSGGLLIYDLSNGKHENVTGTTTTVAAGEKMTLQASFADGSKVEAPKWSGITQLSGTVTPSGVASPDAIKSYLFEDSLGSVTNLLQSDFGSTEVDFYWIHSHTYTVQVSAIDPRTGAKEKTTATFVVQLPEVENFSAETCGVGLRTTPLPPTPVTKAPGVQASTADPLLIMGLNDATPGCANRPGIDWHVTLTEPGSSGGTVGLTQLVNQTLTRNTTPCSFRGRLLNGHAYLADNGDLYDRPVGLDAGQNLTLPGPMNDSPSTGLPGAGLWVNDFRAADYLMFRPDGADSIWVPLQVMDWEFSARVDRASRNSQIRGHSDPKTYLVGAATGDEPSWTGVLLGGTEMVAGCV